MAVAEAPTKSSATNWVVGSWQVLTHSDQPATHVCVALLSCDVPRLAAACLLSVCVSRQFVTQSALICLGCAPDQHIETMGQTNKNYHSTSFNIALFLVLMKLVK